MAETLFEIVERMQRQNLEDFETIMRAFAAMRDHNNNNFQELKIRLGGLEKEIINLNKRVSVLERKVS